MDFDLYTKSIIQSGIETTLQSKFKNAIDTNINFSYFSYSKEDNIYLCFTKTIYLKKFFNFVNFNNIYQEFKVAFVVFNNDTFVYKFNDANMSLKLEKKVITNKNVDMYDNYKNYQSIFEKYYLIVNNTMIQTIHHYKNKYNFIHVNMYDCEYTDNNIVCYKLFVMGINHLLKCLSFKGKFLVFNQYVIFRTKKNETDIKSINDFINHFMKYKLKIIKLNEYYFNISNFRNYIKFQEDNFPNASDIDVFKGIVKLINTKLKKNIKPIIYNGYIVDFYFLRDTCIYSENTFSHYKFNLKDYTIFNCSICEEMCITKNKYCCNTCNFENKLMCTQCSEFHIKAKIENNIEYGIEELKINCLCDKMTLLKSDGSQNKSQYFYILETLNFNILKESLKIWRFNMLNSYVIQKKISPEDKQKFINEQKNLLDTIKSDEENKDIVATNCPLCGIIIIKNTGCNAVVCMNKSAGCNAKFCIVCKKVFNYSTDRHELCNCKTNQITGYYIEPQQVDMQHNLNGTTNFNKFIYKKHKLLIK